MHSRAFILVFLIAVGFAETSFGNRADCVSVISGLNSAGSGKGEEASRLENLETQTAKGSLISYQEGLSAAQIKKHNEKILAALKDPVAPTKEESTATITRDEALVIFKAVANHPTNGRDKEEKYDPEDCFGFCFGRAVMVHTEALRRGVDPASIKKIWAVGSLEKGKWHFHVATMVKSSRTGSWWVIDPVYGTVINAETWISRMQNSSDDNQMMVFVTDPRRFSVYSPQHYTEIDLLGVGVSDYYRGYF